MFECQTITLSNGLRIVHCPTQNQVSYCGFMVDCGTRHEAHAGEHGMAHFIEHMLFKGTQRRNAWCISNRMERVGGELNAFTGKEDTTFYSVFQPKDFDRAAELLCDLICHATIPSAEMEREKEVVIDEIESYNDNPSELIFDVFENQLYAGTPLGHNILGTAETVRAFTQQQCLHFVDQHYTPSRMVFFSYGSTRFDHVVRTLERHFDARPAAEAVPCSPDAKAADQAMPALSDKDERHQCHVMLGGKAYPFGHKNGAALVLLNNMLGGPGMNSRLNQELREKRGLVYTVESVLSRYTDDGYFGIYFGCDHADVDRCLRLCRNQLQRLIDTPLTPHQLQAIRKQYKGQLSISTANLENNAITIAKQLMRNGKVSTLEQTFAHIDTITPQQMQEVAAELFDAQKLQLTMLR